MNPALALSIYNHVSRRLDRFFETGWRRAFGWLAVLVAYFSYVQAPLAQIEIDYANVNMFLGMATAMFVARGAEKFARDRGSPFPGGGLVNNEALQGAAA